VDIIEVPSPDTIGPYRVLRSIAQGGMAAVFEAQEGHKGRRVAVKLLTHRGLARPRFAREYRALTRLDHPNIVRVYRYGMHEGNPYLSMELLDGDPVQVFAKNIGRPGNKKRTQEVTRVVADLADALQYLHDRAIVHRDLKSSNIVVLPDGRAKLLDFGTARYLSGAESITRQGEFVGTFAYASPEQILGGHVDGRSDLYSMGVLLYRLLTGKRPFDADSPHELAKLHVERRPPPPSKLVSKIPAALDELVMRLLEKDPADRPLSASVVAEFLRGQADEKSSSELMLGPGRLVGREAFFDSLRDILTEPTPGSMVLIVGAEGSGRARMMRMAVALARQMGLRTFGGNFGGERGIGILAEVIEDIRHSLEGNEVPIQSQSWSEMRMTATSRLEAVYLDMVEILVQRCKADVAPVVIALGDLHRASPNALDAISYVRQKLKTLDVPVLFLCTAPDESDAPGTAIRKRVADAHRIELGPLTAAQVRELTTSILGGRPLSREICKRIYKVTSGLPGYVGEVVRAMVQGGVLAPVVTEEGVVWEERSEGKLSIPTTARDAIGLRIDGLSVELNRALELLAVAGGEARLDSMAFAMEISEEALEVLFDELSSRRLVETRELVDGAVWNFRIELTRQMIMERMRPLRRAVFERRLSNAILHDPPGPEKVRLLVAAGRIDEALEDLVVWADPLLDWFRAEEARGVLEMFSEVVHRVRQVDRASLCRFYLLLGRARLLARAGGKDAEPALQRAFALAPDDLLKAEVELHRARGEISRGQLMVARATLDKAKRRLNEDAPKLSAMISMELGSVFWYLGDFVEATARFEEALMAAQRGDWPRIVAKALAGRGVVRQCRGRFQDAEQDLRGAIERFALLGDQTSMWHCQGNLCDILRRRGCFSEVVTLLEPELGAVREGGNWTRKALFVLNLAETEVELLQLGRARERVRGIIGDVDLQEHLHMRAAVGLIQARIALVSQDHERAVSLLEPLMQSCREAGVHVMTSQLQALLGEARVKLGDIEKGADDLAEAIQSLQQQTHLPSLGDACAARARAMGTREDPDLSFGPVLHWMQEEPVRVLKLEYLLCSARYAESCNKRERAKKIWLEAQGVYHEIAQNLVEADKEALSVHPWMAAIERGINI